ncbi:MAG: translation initiation factor IF-2 N-terminal domain-containing protein, partial [Candidatus Sulfotelmatobacter sp.]
MSKVRINDLARELEVKSRAILDTLPLVGVTEKKTHSSSLEEHEAEKVRVYIRSAGESSSSAGKSARSGRGEEEIKTKIDLSHISRPGDVLKAITQRKEAVAAPVAPRAVPPPVTHAPVPQAPAEKPAAAPPAAVSHPTTVAPPVVKAPAVTPPPPPSATVPAAPPIASRLVATPPVVSAPPASSTVIAPPARAMAPSVATM